MRSCTWWHVQWPKLICPYQRKSDPDEEWNCNRHPDHTHEMEVYHYTRGFWKQAKTTYETGLVMCLQTTSRVTGSVKSGVCVRANSFKEYKLQTIKDLAILRRSPSAFVQIDHDMKNTLAGAWTVMMLCCSNTFDGWLVYWVIDL